MKKLLFILLLLPLFAFPQAEKAYRSIIIDSVKALNGGRIDVKDTLLLDSLAVYNSDLSSQYTSRSLVDSAFVGSAISGSGHAPVTLSGTPDYITLSGQDIIRGLIDLGTDITGTTTATSISDFDTEVSNNVSVTANTAKVTNATHTGDVTGATVLTIANKAVEIIMLDDGTDGELITWDATGVAATVAVGTAGQVLTSNGTGAAPTFQAGGGDGDSSFVTLQVDSVFPFNNNTIAFDTTTLFLDGSNNRIGIGTVSPLYKLQLTTTTSDGIPQFAIRTGSNNAVELWNGITTGGGILMRKAAGSTSMSLGLISLSHMSFGHNIGINTIAPSLALTVKALAAIDGLQLESSTAKAHVLLVTSSNGGGLRLNDNAGTTKILNINDFGAGPDFINTGRDIGIGLSSSVGAKLTVAGINATSSNFVFLAEDNVGTDLFSVRNDGQVISDGEFSTTKKDITLGAATTTFATTGNVMKVTGDGGGNTVATITGALSGQYLIMIFVDGNVTITDDNTHAANSVDLSAAFTGADDTTLHIIFDGTSWYEVSRSTN